MPETCVNALRKPCICQVHDKHCRAMELAFGHGETVLLAEQNSHIQKLGASLLSQLNYQVVIARNLEQVIELCLNSIRKIDLLVLDISIPENCSEDFLEKIRACQPGVRVVFYSTIDWQTEPAFRRLGEFVPVMSKPFSIRDFSRIIDLALH